MDIRINSYNNFKGYDARPLKGFLMGTNVGDIASEMKEIGKKEGFKIYGVTEKIWRKPVIMADYLPETEQKSCLWAQDLWTILKGKLLAKRNDETTDVIGKFFNLKTNFIKQSLGMKKEDVGQSKHSINIYELMQENDKYSDLRFEGESVGVSTKEAHISGGNVYIIKGDKGDEVIIGSGELEKYTKEEIANIYNVSKVTVLPQRDYHIDLFIRPLDKKRILLADDELTLKFLKDLYIKLSHNKDVRSMAAKGSLKYLISHFAIAKANNLSSSADLSEKILKDAGYEVIRVPGNIYDIDRFGSGGDCTIRYKSNFLNANVLVNKDGDLVYITNKSLVDNDIKTKFLKKIGMDFGIEEAFIDAVSPYIKPEHIYFVQGEKNYISNKMLWEYLGGIHCACSEIPEEI